VILIAASTVIALFAASYERKQGAELAAEKAKAKLADFKIEDVFAIEFRYAALPPVRIDIEGGKWMVYTDGKPAVTADPAKVVGLLNELNSTTLLREIKVEPGKETELALADFALEKPAQRSGYEVRIYGKDGRILLDIMLGDAHFKPAEKISDRYALQSPDGRYVRVNEPDGTHACYLISRIFETCFPYSGHWIEQLRILTFDIPERISYFEKNEESGKMKVHWSVRRKSGPGTYYLETPKGKTLKPKKLDTMIKLLINPFTRDIAPEGVDFKPDSKYEIVLANHFTYTLEMQDSDKEMKRYARLTVTFEPEKLTQKSGETMQAFQVRKEELVKRLAYEKEHFEGRIFVLRPNIINILREIPGS